MICCHSVSRVMNGSYSEPNNRKETSSRLPTAFAQGSKPPVVLLQIQPISEVLGRLPCPCFPAVGCVITRDIIGTRFVVTLPLSRLSPSPSHFLRRNASVKRCKKARKPNTNCQLCRRSSRLRRRSDGRV